MNKLLDQLQYEYRHNKRGGIYAFTQYELAYNSNRIEGSKLDRDHTVMLFETGTIVAKDDVIFRAKDIEEAEGHFAMFNTMLNTYDEELSPELIKKYHYKFKSGVFEDIANGYAAGDWKTRYNTIGGNETVPPSDVDSKIGELLSWYNNQEKSLETLAAFHIQYEKIHPFQDGNGRTGRIILFKECLKNNILPFIVTDAHKNEYYAAFQNPQKMCEFFKIEQLEYEKTVDRLINAEQDLDCKW